MTTYFPSTNEYNPQPRFLVPCTPMQRLPDMPTYETEAMHERAWDVERRKLLKVQWLLMRDLNTSERHYGRYEMDNARLALPTEDEQGNVTVRNDS